MNTLPNPKRTRILVIGDLILDAYMRGSVSRMSPEAPVAVLHDTVLQQTLGGAANVANNLAALGVERVVLCGAIGDDSNGQALCALLQAQGLFSDGIFIIPSRVTSHKLRIIAQAQQMIRVDNERKEYLANSDAARVLHFIKQTLPSIHGVICSDYGKGFLHPDMMQAIVRMCKAQDIPVIVDPKGRDYRMYHGAAVLTPNLHEIEQATGVALTEDSHTETLQQAVNILFQIVDAQAILLTCGKKGMVLFEAHAAPVVIAAQTREVYDVTGAGDTVIATFALAYVAGIAIQDAAKLSNIAAGVVVGKSGTATVQWPELTRAVLGSRGNVVSRSDASVFVQHARARGERVVFTNGCFDLLHAGHVQHLEAAKNLGDILIIGLNSDASATLLKGPKRPFINEQERAQVLAALRCVDLVVLFDEETPQNLIDALCPDILVKGNDYQDRVVVGRETVEKLGGRVELLPFEYQQSTTDIAQKILQRYST